MAVRLRVPLPGPFVWTSSGRSSSAPAVGLALFAGLLLLGLCYASPAIGIPVTLFVVVLAVAVVRDAVKRTRR